MPFEITALWKQGENKHCAVLIDLDLFKSVNDIYPDKRLYKAKAAGRNKIMIDWENQEFKTDNPTVIIAVGLLVYVLSYCTRGNIIQTSENQSL